MKHFNFSRLFDNKTFTKIFSIIGAIIIWSIVTLTVKSDSARTLRSVPIDFSVSGTAVETLGLSAFEHSADTVDIQLSGNRGSLNSLSRDDIAVSLQLGRVTNTGKYTVDIEVALKKIEGNVKIVNYSPKTIQVNFDTVASKTFPVDVKISDISAAEGYLLDKGYPSSTEITVSGPQSVINNINSCIAKVDTKKKNVNKTLSVSSVELTLLDEKGNAISNPSITVDKENVDVSIPVLKVKEVPIAVHFINQPSSFNEKDFGYTLSVSKLNLAGPVETIDSLSQLDLRYADLKNIKPGDTVTLNVELPSGYLNVDNIESVDVTIPSENFGNKTFNVKNFKLIGVPEGKKVLITTKQLNNIKLMGEQSVLSTITSNDIVVEVDVSSSNLTGGAVNVPATISVPGKDGVFWAYGTYEVLIYVEG